MLDAFEAGEAAIAPIYSIADIFDDPQYAERGTIATVEHPVLGPVRMPNVIPRLSETPGRIEHPGPDLGSANRDVYEGELGLSAAEIEALKAGGII